MDKVLHVIYHARFGGIEKVVFDILKHQSNHAKSTQDLLILKPEGEFLRQFEELPVTVHQGAFASGLDFSRKKVTALKALFRQYDIIHFHVFHLPAILKAISVKAKTVYTEHGNFGFGRKVRFTDRVNHFCKGIFLRRHVSFITYNSEFTRHYAQQKYGLKHGREKVVYNGIDFSHTGASAATDFTASDSTFNIGTISRLAGFKRIDRLIAAFARFADQKTNVRLYIGGDGVLKSTLETQTRELNIANKVIFTGYLKNAPDFMRQMQVCVFPSQNEPFGIVAVESLSKERPTVVFADGGGLVEIIERNNPEDVVDDEQALVNRLEDYYSGKEKQAVSPLVKQSLTQDFSISTMCTSLNKIYTSL